MNKISKICDFDFLKSKQTMGKSTSWCLKAITDALKFATNEGIDVTKDPKTKKEVFSPDFVSEIETIASEFVNKSRFGKKEKITYWIQNF